MKASMFMDRDGIHSSRDEHEGKEETWRRNRAIHRARTELTRTRSPGVLRYTYLRQHFRRLGHGW